MTSQPMRAGAKNAAIFVAVGAGLLFLYHRAYGGYFPGAGGLLGVDYTYFFPRLLDGYFWYHVNGPWRVPWFTPSFCGGLPFFGNPQSMYYSVPQALTILFGPLKGVYFTVLLFAFVGFAGFYLLLKDAFGASRPVAYLGAALFMFNGFYSHRMILGHFAFHAYQLLPLACYFLLKPLPEKGWGRGRRYLLDSAAAGALFAMMIHSGMLELGLPVGAAVAMVGAFAGICNGRNGEFWSRFALAGVIALALGAARLSATLAFMEQFSRDHYNYPGGVRSALKAVWLLAQTVYFWPDESLIFGARFWMGAKWFTYGLPYYEYSVTAAPLALLAPAVYFWGRRLAAGGIRSGSALPIVLNLALMAFIAALVGVLLCSFQDPRWARFMKKIPVMNSYSNMMVWISALIPAAILVPLALFDRLRPADWILYPAAALCAAVAALHVTYHDDSFYRRQYYPAAELEAAYTQVKEGGMAPMAERMEEQAKYHPEYKYGDKLPLGADDFLGRNESSTACYEPIFGYNLERYPIGQLRPGSPMEERGGFLNIKNPACYLFPKENACVPGSHFAAGQADLAEAFVRYKPIDFKIPFRQTLANWITLLGIGFIAAVAAVNIACALRPIFSRRGDGDLAGGKAGAS